jgi:hypothetical protein
MNQYLSEEQLTETIPVFDILPNELGSTDTYHEEKILKKVLNYSKFELELLIKSAIQIAIIGSGGKNLGFIYDKDKNVIELKQLYTNLKVKYGLIQNSKLEDDDLTPRRLVRLFRYQIRDFIRKTQRCSYLWVKYADKSDKRFMDICFPGAEHLITTKEEANFLYNTYKVLDIQLGTRFELRLQRVFIAREIYKPAEIQNINKQG